MNNLLPCPACGNTHEYTEIDYWLVSKREERARRVCQCGAASPWVVVARFEFGWESQVDSAWNAMPRGYARTTEPPITDGWYFTRVMEPGKPWRVFYVKKDGTKSQSQGYMLACETMESEYGWVIADNSENREWAGPIPMPTDRG